MEPVVSICCITYNHEKYIRDAIESFLMQKTTFSFEIIIHDDASTDKTTEVIKEFANKYPNLIVPILQEENQWSKGIKISNTFVWPLAKGKYIALCEGDDYWTDPHKLQKQVDFMEEYNECSMCFHRAKIIGTKHSKFEDYSRDFSPIEIFPEKELFYEGGSSAPTATIIFRRDILQKATDFPGNVPVGDMWLKVIMSYYGRIGYIKDVMAARRLGHAGSWNVRTRKNNKAEIKYLSGMINWLTEVNKFMNFKYNKVLFKIAIQYDMKRIKLGEDKSLILNGLSNNNLLKNISLYQKFLVLILRIFPKLSTIKILYRLWARLLSYS